MIRRYCRSGFPVSALCLWAALQAGYGENAERKAMSDVIQLPSPDSHLNCDLNQALQERRSVREYKEGELKLKEVGQLLWAAQGTTSIGGYRTAPSAGALYPLETYLVAGKVEKLEPGVYRYDVRAHTLTRVAGGDKRRALADACLGQSWMSPAPAMIAFAAVYPRTTDRYGERGRRYVHMEVGHAGQNVSLAAVALKLGAVVVAAFDDAQVARVLELPPEEAPLYLMPVGRK